MIEGMFKFVDVLCNDREARYTLQRRVRKANRACIHSHDEVVCMLHCR